MRLTLQSIKNEREKWLAKGFVMPDFDIEKMRENTKASPEWIHFGAGNIFRGFIACLADELLGKGELQTGIIAAGSHDPEIIERIYKPYDNLALLAGLRASGDRYLRVIAGIAEANGSTGEGLLRLKECARSDSLKMVSYTITEKGYAVRGIGGEVFDFVKSDIEAGPSGEHISAMSVTAALLYERFRAGAKPVALVSMDNCSENGRKLRESVLFVIKGWVNKGLAEKAFLDYASDETKVSFPWSMIDKITPRPAQNIADELTAAGVEEIEPIVTKRNTFIAPFVNAEMPQYLVIEDNFPNGRPPLEKAGVYMTDRETVGRSEQMKVMTCLNPLHTALAVFGCLLGFGKISDEMGDPALKKLVYGLGFTEGLPVVVDPKIISPRDFLNEVLTERLPNANLPDTPQRIATDTSQKLAIRFGGTISAYEKRGEAGKLRLIPLVIAAWIRYLTGIDDNGESFERSPDPMLSELSETVRPDWFGKTADSAAVMGLLANSTLFGTDLVKAGLAETIIADLNAMLAGKGAVRKTLEKAVE